MILSLLKKLHYRLELWIEKLEDRQPSGPCDPLVAADVARLSRRIYDHSKTVNPYADMVNKDNPFPNGDRLTNIEEEQRCSICGEKLENCPNRVAVNK